MITGIENRTPIGPELRDEKLPAYWAEYRDYESRAPDLHSEVERLLLAEIASASAQARPFMDSKQIITNTCSYPVEVAWCANVRECNGPGGNLWTIGAGRGYPIFFSDEANPYIEISACRTGANAKPLPGPYGSFSEDHLPPHPASAPAVHVMTKHICGGG